MARRYLPHYLALALLALLFAGCGNRARQEEETAYDLTPSELMMDVGYALLAKPENAAEITANLHADDLARHEWGAEAQKLSRLNEEYRRRYRLFAEARELLEQGRMNELTKRIDLAEQQGESSFEVLTLRELPLALQALELYCRRMPFQHSTDVEYALAALMPYRMVLDRSSAFREFLKEQQNLAEVLRVRERQEEILRWLKQMDGAICCGDNAQMNRILSELQANYPESPLQRWLDSPGTNRRQNKPSGALRAAVDAGTSPLAADASGTERVALELAMALCRATLEQSNATGFRKLVASLPENVTVTGTALKAACQKSVPCFEKAIGRWSDAHAKEPGLFDRTPVFLDEYLRLCGLRHRIRKGTSPVDVMVPMEVLLAWSEVK